MTTIHAPTPRDALTRLETMVLMAGFDLPMRAIRDQVASAIDLIIQVDRLPDGRRVVSSLTELQGLEGDIVLLQEVFHLVPDGTDLNGRPVSRLAPTGLRPKFLERLDEKGIKVPATSFRAPAKTPPAVLVGAERGRTSGRNGRRVTVPDAHTLAERGDQQQRQRQMHDQMPQQQRHAHAITQPAPTRCLAVGQLILGQLGGAVAHLGWLRLALQTCLRDQRSTTEPEQA